MTHQFTVTGMTCGHCASRVATSLRRRDPEARISVDLTAGKVSVDGAAEGSDYAEALRDAGHPGIDRAMPRRYGDRQMKTKYFELSEARNDGLLNIGRAAEASGVSAKMIRHYEAIGLLPAAGRTVAGYRIYREGDVHILKFIRRARDMGFSMKEIGALVGLWQNRRRASGDVKKLAARHMQQLDEKIRELQAMRDSLSHLANHCHGDDRPDCPILDDLAAPDHSVRTARKSPTAVRHMANSRG